MHVVPGLFHRYDPAADSVPVVFDVSRSGREYPCEFRSPVPFSAIHDNVSMYVEELYEAAPGFGATLLYALFPNTYIDANRHELDLDSDLVEGNWPEPLQPTISKRGLGLLKAKSRYGEPMHERKYTVGEVMERLDRYHRPYHAELRRIIEEQRSSFGFAYQVSCHCMSEIGAPTHPDPGEPRADFCVADVDGKTASPDFVHFLRDEIAGMGYSVSINWPYNGGELNSRYGDPTNGVESVMLEINKKLFIDVKSFKKNSGFEKLRGDLNKLISRITERARTEAKARGIDANFG